MIVKFQQGGAAPQSANQDMQKQVVALVQAAMQGNEEARKQVEEIMAAAKQGNQQAIQLAQMIQDVVQAMQNQARRQKMGGKMDYIHKLRTGANPGEEVVYEKCGGKVTKKHVKKACGGKKLSMQDGGNVAKKTYFEACGGKTKKPTAKKCYFGGSL